MNSKRQNKLIDTNFIIFGWVILLTLTGPVAAQDDQELTVTTLAEARANGDIFVDDAGDLYISDFGPPNLGNGSTVVKITAEGAVTTVATGLSAAPSGITMANNGDLYVATLNGGDVYRIQPSGAKTIVNSGLRGPVGLTFDNSGNLYVAECSNNRISRLTNGNRQTVASIGGLGCANGITWGHDNALYVLMWQDGKIYRVDLSGNVSLFADIPGGGGHIELLDGAYYALARTNHQVYRIELDGTVSLFAGTGEDGNQDGPIETATISRPNGIGVDHNTGAIYLTGSSDFSLNQIPIRKIALQATEPVNDFIINPGLAGSWYDPALDGQGVVLDFALGEDRFDAVMYWFTYNDAAADPATELNGFGSTQHRWFTSIGSVQDNATVNMPIYRSASGVFHQADVPIVDVVGTAELEFFSCFEAVLNYQFTVPEDIVGSISLQRLTPDINCESFNASVNIQSN